MELVILALVAGLFFTSYALWRRARHAANAGDKTIEGRKAAPALPPAERTIHTITNGDVVTYMDTDWLVEGVLTLDEDGRVTRLYKMIDGAKTRWLAARPGEDEPFLLDEAPELVIDPSGPDALTHAGIPYRLTARAVVQVIRSGSLGATRPGEKARLYEYTGAGSTRLVAVAGGERVDVYRGERVPATMIDILPGG